MISLAALKPEQAERYFKQDNYYSKEDSEEHSFWWGKAAKKLGVSGTVKTDEFGNLCRGMSADGSEKIVGGKRGEALKRSGTDVCLSAPKSISLAALVGGDKRLIEAHQEAVKVALEVLEKRYACTRSGGQKDRQVERTGNLAVACFEHNVSREKDPQLHTHCVVLSMTERGDRRWRSGFHNQFWESGKLIGTLYQAELAKRCKQLGYEIETRSNGTFEIKGYEQAQLREFSKRTEKIEALGCRSKEEERIEKMKIRPPKGKTIPLEELQSYWRQRAEAHGVRHPSMKEGESDAPSVRRVKADGAFQFSTEHLSERQVRFSRKSLEIAMLAKSLGDVGWKDCQSRIRSGYEGGELIEARASGINQHFTTQKALGRERVSAKYVANGLGTCQPITDSEQVERRLSRIQKVSDELRKTVCCQLQELTCVTSTERTHSVVQRLACRLETGEKLGVFEGREFKRELLNSLSEKPAKELVQSLVKTLESVEGLSAGQKAAIQETATSRDRFVAWQGVAGAGKSFAINELREIAENAGYKMRGFAPSAEAAKVLGSEGQCEADTVASLLVSRTKKSDGTPELWVVDEAGLLGQCDAKALLEKAVDEGARVVLVGDTRQLASVGAGSAFRFLQESGIKTIQLSESRRQKDLRLADAANLMGKGNVDEALDLISDKIIERKKEEARDKLCARQWLSLPERERERTLIIAGTHKERESITDQIRQSLKNEGGLTNESKVQAFRRKDLTKPQMCLAYSYEEGDIVELPERGGKVSRLKVHEVDVLTNCLVLQRENGTRVLFDVAKLEQARVFQDREIAMAEGDKMRWTQNDKENHRLNGQEFTVTKVQDNGMSIEYRDGRREFVDKSALRHVDYSWTSTTFSSQGKTCDRVLVVADESMTKNSAYVALTRARHDVMFFVDDKETFLGRARRSGEKEHAHEVVLPASIKGERNVPRELPEVEVNCGSCLVEI